MMRKTVRVRILVHAFYKQPVLREVKLICNLLSTHQFVKELQLLRQICPKRVYLNIVKMHLLGSKTSLSLEDVN